MLTSTIALALIIARPSVFPPIVCPIAGNPANDAKVATVDYNGVHFQFCCAGCPEEFAKDPAKALKNPKLNDKTFGTFLFDPVARKRIKPEQAKGGEMDYNGIRYTFFTAENLSAFQKDPAAYGTMPTKEVLHCPVANEKLHGYQLAYTYKDVAGVRYYICCAGCAPKFEKDPSKYLAGVKSKIKSPSAWKWEPGQATPSECKD